jgi:hypothetical protein
MMVPGIHDDMSYAMKCGSWKDCRCFPWYTIFTHIIYASIWFVHPHFWTVHFRMKLNAIILLLIKFWLMHNFYVKLVDIDINVNSILSRGILILLFIKVSLGGVCTCSISISSCHIAFNCNYIFCENYVLVEILSRGIFIQYVSMNCMVEAVTLNIQYFPWKLCVNQSLMMRHFHFRVHQGISWWGPQIWIFISGCHITFFIKIVHWLKFYWWALVFIFGFVYHAAVLSFKIKSFWNLSLHYMFHPTRPSSGMLKFGGAASASVLLQSVFSYL